MKRVKIIKIAVFLIIATLIAFLLICQFAIEKNNNKIQNTKNTQLVRDITFEPYSNSNNIYVLVVIEDNEYGLRNINYKDKNNEEITINTNGKNKIAVDYEIVNDGEYVFKAENEVGEKFEKTLIVDSDYRKLIDINIQPNADTELVTEENVSIDYSKVYNSENIAKQYKIGKSTTWVNYTSAFKIDSYTVLNNSWQESDNKTVIIYARTVDNAKNTVTISQETLKLDLDKADKPIITQTSGTSYICLTTSGIKINATVNIVYNTKTDAYNYYSIDNGTTWQQYSGTFTTSARYIKAKSVNKISGLTSDESTLKLDVTANDAVGINAFDGNGRTGHWIDVNETHYFAVDSSVEGKTIGMYYNGFNGTGWTGIMTFYGADKKTVYKTEYMPIRSNYTHLTYQTVCPAGTRWISITIKGNYACDMGLKNIYII